MSVFPENGGGDREHGTVKLISTLTYSIFYVFLSCLTKQIAGIHLREFNNLIEGISEDVSMTKW